MTAFVTAIYSVGDKVSYLQQAIMFCQRENRYIQYVTQGTPARTFWVFLT